MASVDDLLETARQKTRGRASENIAITRGTLKMFVDEIEQLRAATSQIELPNKNTRGQHHTRASSTERAAAMAVMPRSGTQRMTVLQAIADSPDGLTDPEVSRKTGIYLYSAAPRRCELLDGGWVTDSGKRRSTGHGGEAIVWVATEKTRVALRNHK
jgi:hypothetical protein